MTDKRMVLFSAGAFQITAIGLAIEGKPTFAQWQAFGAKLQAVGHSIQLAIGDWLNYGECAYGETYTQAIEATGIEDARRLANYKWVSSRVPLSLRNDNLSYTTYYHAACVEDVLARNNLLCVAASAGWDSKTMKAEVDKINGKQLPTDQELLTASIWRVYDELNTIEAYAPDAKAKQKVIDLHLEVERVLSRLIA